MKPKTVPIAAVVIIASMVGLYICPSCAAVIHPVLKDALEVWSSHPSFGLKPIEETPKEVPPVGLGNSGPDSLPQGVPSSSILDSRYRKELELLS